MKREPDRLVRAAQWLETNGPALCTQLQTLLFATR